MQIERNFNTNIWWDNYWCLKLIVSELLNNNWHELGQNYPKFGAKKIIKKQLFCSKDAVCRILGHINHLNHISNGFDQKGFKLNRFFLYFTALLRFTNYIGESYCYSFVLPIFSSGHFCVRGFSETDGRNNLKFSGLVDLSFVQCW